MGVPQTCWIRNIIKKIVIRPPELFDLKLEKLTRTSRSQIVIVRVEISDHARYTRRSSNQGHLNVTTAQRPIVVVMRVSNQNMVLNGVIEVLEIGSKAYRASQYNQCPSQ